MRGRLFSLELTRTRVTCTNTRGTPRDSVTAPFYNGATLNYKWTPFGVKLLARASTVEEDNLPPARRGSTITCHFREKTIADFFIYSVLLYKSHKSTITSVRVSYTFKIHHK